MDGFLKVKTIIQTIQLNSGRDIDHIRVRKDIFDEVFADKYKPKTDEEKKLFEQFADTCVPIVLDESIRDKKGFKIIYKS